MTNGNVVGKVIIDQGQKLAFVVWINAGLEQVTFWNGVQHPTSGQQTEYFVPQDESGVL